MKPDSSSQHKPKVRLKYESITVSAPSAHQLHMTRFYKDKRSLGAPVFMIHDVLEDSNRFFKQDGSGLACYLAQQGYDVFVADLRGKGKSWPRIGPSSDFGLHQQITEDIPALVKRIVAKRGTIPQIWVAHGWGGVLLCAAYARFGDSLCRVAKMVHFGTRRKSNVSNFKKRFLLGFWWQKFCRLLVKVNGYLPSKLMRLGYSNETAQTFEDYLAWTWQQAWKDPEDGFNYVDGIRKQQLPPSYYFASTADKAYGHPDDVRQFVKELGPHDSRLMILSRKGGNLQDYSHQDMLAHKDCEEDHFPLILDWLDQQ